MTPQEISTIAGAIATLVAAIAGYFARPKVERVIARRKARKHVEQKSEDPIVPPGVK